MKIEAGKYYRTRDGRKVGPMNMTASKPGTDRWRGKMGDGESFWHDDGTHWSGRESKTDLIAEWTDEPAAPKPSPFVTRRELVPGVYGIVSVVLVGVSIHIDVEHDGLTAEQADEAAHLFTQLAEYLRETK